MPRLILKSPYLKPRRKKSPGGYLKYIATREGVEMAENTSRHLPATTEQQKQIEKLLKKYPDSRSSRMFLVKPRQKRKNRSRTPTKRFVCQDGSEHQSGHLLCHGLRRSTEDHLRESLQGGGLAENRTQGNADHSCRAAPGIPPGSQGNRSIRNVLHRTGDWPAAR